MYKNIRIISVFLAVLCFAVSAIAQETTGIIEITTKDSTGAVVPGVTVTVQNASGTRGFKRTVTTNDAGFQRVIQVPPGSYTVKSEPISGFTAKTFTNVQVVLGRATSVNLDLSIGGVDAIVDVTAGDNATIDTTETRIQTNITAETAELLPKGTNFASLLKVSPSTRPESKSGGYQIDGASGSENTFIVDGNEVTNALSGTLDANNNLPFQLIQEVQVKSSGFEAEYSGATGGVINVVTKGGNNEFRGEFGLSFSPSKLQEPRRELLYLDSTGSRYLSYDGLDDTNGYFPSATFSGPILKDRVWFLGSYTPQFYDFERTIPYVSMDPVTYRSSQKNEYGFGRIDAQPFDSLRLTSTYVWNPISTQGTLPSIADQTGNSLPSGNGLTGTEYTDTRGGRQNANIFTASGVWTATNNLVVAGRYGRNFINNKLGTYGLPSPFPYTPSNSRIGCSSASGQPPAGSGCTGPGQYNGIAWAGSTVFDATVRETYDFDGTYIFDAGGRHEFKGGYQRNSISNDVLSPRNAYILLYYTSPGANNAIDQRSGRNVTPTPGNIGSGRVITFGAQGQASSTNDGIYVQDKWQPSNRLTLNLGFRIEKEEVPSFNEFSAIQFGWADKIAPRIGVAYDLTGDGKTKVSGFFGWFYDRFKYDLPRGSFGGNIYYSNWFELTDPNKDYRTYDPGAILGGGQNVIVGGACPQTGFAYSQVRCFVDHRVPSNDPSLDVAEQGGVDPNILPMRQTELSFSVQREFSDKYLLTVRYLRKKLDRAVEDAGFITPTGSEAYIIGNPGLGLVKQFYEQNGWTPVTAKRKYDAVEIGVNRRFADNYYFNANYTWSRLWGNYSGLASSDEEGRTDPNVSRAFDAPFTESTIAGGETVGLLATDRPHVFKFSGAYALPWNSNNSTEFQTFFTAQSGTPLTQFATVAGYNSIIVNERGDMGRTDFYSQADFAVRHRYKFGRDNKYTLVGEVDFTNLFNQKAVTDRFNNNVLTNYSLTSPANGLVTAAEAAALTSGQLTSLAEGRFQSGGASTILGLINSSTNTDVRYNLAENFQGGRDVRFGFRFIF